MTPAVLSRLARRKPPRSPGSIPLSRLLPRPVYGVLEAVREEVILDRLATLTAIHDDPWTAARLMFGGNA